MNVQHNLRGISVAPVSWIVIHYVDWFTPDWQFNL